MTSTDRRTLSVAIVIGFYSVASWPSPLLASVYTFDVTSQIDQPFASAGDSLIDLGVTFSHVNSVSVNLSGTFTPGLKTLFTIPAHTAPAVTSDQVSLAIRLGDEGTTWFDKEAYAIQELHGLSGGVNFTLPLLAAHPSPSLPVLFPDASGTPDFQFLLDGRFAIATLGISALGGIDEELVAPKFEPGNISIVIDGASVPEPATATLLMLAMLRWGCQRRLS
jgi:hypothetical protein